MAEHYTSIANYLRVLQDKYGVQICIKDFCGFIPINKELDEALRPFLTHTNPYCMYMKSNPAHWRMCLSMIRGMVHKLEQKGSAYFGICHGGLGEYVVPIFSGDTLLGSINAGFFPTGTARAEHRICRSCAQEPPLDKNTALSLYREHITPPTIEPEALLPGLELLADYLGLTYRILQQTHTKSSTSARHQTSGEDTILSHAIEYIHRNALGRITVPELAAFCMCSESYLSKIFKRRTGININMYVNKVRVEQAKNSLVNSRDSIADIAAQVGFGCPNYFSRVFTQIIGISPSEYRKRFQE